MVVSFLIQTTKLIPSVCIQVTADGSINCADEPGEQETKVGQLIFCETLAALNVLSHGGTYIFKMFTALECQMICMMYLLCGLFDEVHVVKPGKEYDLILRLVVLEGFPVAMFK